jgi:hypothetical protein
MKNSRITGTMNNVKHARHKILEGERDDFIQLYSALESKVRHKKIAQKQMDSIINSKTNGLTPREYMERLHRQIYIEREKFQKDTDALRTVFVISIVLLIIFIVITIIILDASRNTRSESVGITGNIIYSGNNNDNTNYKISDKINDNNKPEIVSPQDILIEKSSKR